MVLNPTFLDYPIPAIPDPPSSDGGQFQLKRLRHMHREIIRLHLIGLKNTEIAAQQGVTLAVVSYTLNSPLAKQVLSNNEDEMDVEARTIHQRLEEIAPVSVDIIEDVLLDADTPAILRLKAAESILDRAGYGKISRVQGSHVHAHAVTVDTFMERLTTRLAVAKTEPGLLDCEAEESEAIDV